QHKLPKDITLANAKVLYEGQITSPYTGLHRLHFKYSGYMKVWIDGELQEDRWRESWNAGTFEISKEMKSGETYDIRMEWRSEEHTSELQSRKNLVCRLLVEKKKKKKQTT